MAATLAPAQGIMESPNTGASDEILSLEKNIFRQIWLSKQQLQVLPPLPRMVMVSVSENS